MIRLTSWQIGITMDFDFSLVSRIGTFIPSATGNLLSVEEQWAYLAGVKGEVDVGLFF